MFSLSHPRSLSLVVSCTARIVFVYFVLCIFHSICHCLLAILLHCSVYLANQLSGLQIWRDKVELSGGVKELNAAGSRRVCDALT